MRDYFLTLLITSLIGGIICALSDTKFEKPIKYLVSLICIVLILSPISSVFSGGDSFEVSLPEVSVDEEFIGDWIMTETENMLKKSVSEAVFSEEKMCVVAQTTFEQKKWQEFKNKILKMRYLADIIIM